MEIRHVLCPIDLSLTSRRALDHAVMLAGWYGAKLTAVYVVNSPYLAEPPILFGEPTHPTLTEAPGRRNDLETQLHEWLGPARSAGLDCHAVIDKGHNPATRILQCAGSLRADTIVLGTHGRSGFERFMLGSTAEKVLRAARCPVLTVPLPAFKTTRLPFKRILCPVDFSETSIAALRLAFSLAKESDARVTLLHAVEWPDEDATLVDTAFATPEYRLQLEDQIASRLYELISDEERIRCEPETTITYGKAYQRIVSTAESEDADLIVMGVHGRNAVDVMLFGSTTNQVVRRSSCPVMTLKH